MVRADVNLGDDKEDGDLERQCHTHVLLAHAHNPCSPACAGSHEWDCTASFGLLLQFAARMSGPPLDVTNRKMLAWDALFGITAVCSAKIGDNLGCIQQNRYVPEMDDSQQAMHVENLGVGFGSMYSSGPVQPD